MKLTIDAAVLRDACARSLIETGATVQPILKHAHLRADNGALVFTATDTEKMRADILPAEIEADGMATCEAQRLRAVLTAIEGAVQLELKDQRLQVSLPGKRRYRLESLDPDDFPLWEADQVRPLPDLNPERLRFALSRIAYAAGTKDARHYLNGLFIGPDMFLASNGYNGAWVPASSGVEGILIPRASFNALDEILNAAYDSVSFELLTARDGHGSGFRIRTPACAVTTRLLDYPYPVDSFQALIRLSGRVRASIKVHTDDLLNCLDRIRPFASMAGKDGSIHFEYSKDGLLLIPLYDKEARDLVAAELSGDGTFSGAINPDYLRQSIAFAKGKQLIWTLSEDARAPNYFSVEGDEDGHMLMGLRE